MISNVMMKFMRKCEVVNMKTKFLTKREVVNLFIESFRGCIPRGDVTMRRGEWNDFTDVLYKNDQISQHQYDAWTNPFFTK